jgi:signal transduction histidine kinase/ABC-type uncharacterized transport system substrate-binding protein
VYGKVVPTLLLCLIVSLCVAMSSALLSEAASRAEQETGDTAKVLILLGNDGDSTTGAALVLEGLNSGFKKSGRNIEVLREYLSLNIAKSDSEQQQLARQIHEKYTGQDLDLILSVATLPTDFALRHRDLLFPHLPMVFCAYSATQLPRLRGYPNLTGVAVSLGIEDTIRLIMQIHPELRKLAIVAGDDPWDQYLLARTRKLLAEFEHMLTPHIFSAFTMEALLEQIAQLPPQSAILYLSIKKDAAGKRLPFLLGLEMLAEKANAPIYSPLEVTLGHGVVGGQMTDLKSYGLKGAELALRVLRGESAGDIDMEVLADFQPQFDGEMLRRWNINELNLPRSSVIVNKEASIWDQHRWPLIGGLGFFAVQTGLIAFMVVAWQREQRTKKKLLASQDNFRRAQEAGLIGSFVIDVIGKRVSWAEGTHELLGLPPTAQLNFEQFLDLVLAEDRGKVQNVLHNLADHQSGEGEFRLLGDTGTKFVRARWQTLANTTATQPILTGIIQDVTALRNAEARTERLRDNLLRLSRIATVEALSSKIVHEINQPLAAQRTNAEIALHLLAGEPPELEELRLTLRDVLEDNLRIQTIVRGIRGLIKQKAVTSASIDLSELLSGAVKLVRDSRTFDRIAVLLELPPEPVATSGDGVQLQQVFVNLIKNGFEACAQSDISPTCLTVTLREEPETFYIGVADMGSGMTPQLARHIFEPFFTTKEEGVGMGLAISKMIVEAHNGKMDYVENRGPGLTFWVRLPKEQSVGAEG